MVTFIIGVFASLVANEISAIARNIKTKK